MIIRNTTESNDWTYGKGKADYRTDLEGIILNIKTRLQEWKGDCFFAVQNGVDYNNFLDVGTKIFLDSDVKRVILQSEGVLKINIYGSSINRSSRGFTAQSEITTIYGKTVVEV